MVEKISERGPANPRGTAGDEGLVFQAGRSMLSKRSETAQIDRAMHAINVVLIEFQIAGQDLDEPLRHVGVYLQSNRIAKTARQTASCTLSSRSSVSSSWMASSASRVTWKTSAFKISMSGNSMRRLPMMACSSQT